MKKGIKSINEFVDISKPQQKRNRGEGSWNQHIEADMWKEYWPWIKRARVYILTHGQHIINVCYANAWITTCLRLVWDCFPVFGHGHKSSHHITGLSWGLSGVMDNRALCKFNTCIQWHLEVNMVWNMRKWPQHTGVLAHASYLLYLSRA